MDIESTNVVVFSDISQTAYIDSYDTVQEAKSVQQAIRMIIATPKRTRVGRPLFGSYVSTYLFDPFDLITGNKIQTEIIDALEDEDNGETNRITDISVDVVMDWVNISYWVQVKCKVPSLGESVNISTTFTLRNTL